MFRTTKAAILIAVGDNARGQTAPDAVFDAFCASRLGGDWGQAFGTLSARTDFDAILQRATPR